MAAPAPFDVFAGDYDALFSDRLAAGWLRDAVHEQVSPLLREGDMIIDLGCGTGDDAIRFAEAGYRVWGGDTSTNMLEQASTKVRQAGLGSCIELVEFDIAGRNNGELPHDGARLVFSNFGALNCLSDLRPVFDLANSCLQDEGYFVGVTMGRFCLFETLYYTARGKFGKAGRRWSGSAEFDSGDATYTAWYHSPSKMREQAIGFRQVGLYGIGALLPTSEGFDMVDRSPRFFRKLAQWDKRIARFSYPFSDHYLLILQKQAET